MDEATYEVICAYLGKAMNNGWPLAIQFVDTFGPGIVLMSPLNVQIPAEDWSDFQRFSIEKGLGKAFYVA